MWKITDWKKVFDKCKGIHALKQPKNLLRLFSKPNVQTCMSEKYGFYRYECRDSGCNWCASYIQECSSFITSNGYKWKKRCHINCHSTNVLFFFYHAILPMVVPHTLEKL